MFKIAICEDNKSFALELHKIIYQKFLQSNLKCQIRCFYSGEDILENISSNNPRFNIIFFDIELPKLDGLEVAAKIRSLDKDTIFIFITYLNEKVYEALNLNIFHFIRKDYFYEEVNPVLESLIKKLDHLSQVYPFPIDGVDIYFSLYSILYLEILDRHLILHTNRKKYISNYRSLKKIPFGLKENYFFEVYRGVVVNLNHVKDFIDDKLILSDGSIVYIARRRINTFKQEFYKYISIKRGE